MQGEMKAVQRSMIGNTPSVCPRLPVRIGSERGLGDQAPKAGFSSFVQHEAFTMQFHSCYVTDDTVSRGETLDAAQESN